jgi:site-specific recombinase XerD
MPSPGRWPDRAAVDDPLIASFAAFLQLERHHSPRTVTAYRRDVADFGRFLLRRAGMSQAEALRASTFPALESATESDVRRYVMECSGERKFAAVSVLRKVSSLRQFFAFLRRERIRTDNPAADLPRLKKPKSLPKVLNVDEVERLLETSVAGKNDFLRLRDRAIKECLYGSGIRRFELVGLNLQDVDLERRMMRVTYGKGNKQRLVLLSDAAADAMRMYLGVRPRTTDEAFFLSSRKKRISESTVYHVFKTHLKLSGLRQDATPHTMRHSFGTHLVEGGADLMTVKELMGHESTATTQIYTHLSVEHMRKTFERAHPRSRRTRRSS